MAVQRICGKCEGPIGPDDHSCPGCREIVWGGRCTHCNIVGFWDEFPDDACCSCGRPVCVAMTTVRTKVCPGCIRLRPFDGVVCPGCGHTEWGLWVTVALCGVVVAGCGWGFSGAIEMPLLREVTAWGSLVVGFLTTACGVGMLVDCWNVYRPTRNPTES